MTTLELKQVNYLVDGRTILKDLNLKLSSGDWVTVVGPSGTGKSTLLKIIAGLQDATDGEVVLDDTSTTTMPIGTVRQQISYATQSAQLFGETVRDNLDFPFLVRQETVNEAAQRDGLMKMGLPESYLDKAVSELSGGERQRIGVLRNLLFPPKVLLLDEISTGLDSETKKAIWQAIHDLHDRENNIVLSVTHDEQEIAEAQNVLTLHEGEGVLTHE
ncbi:ATP-binding cassette domain-containing protein [Weissella sp. GP1]|uniref:ABC transporter ATP-binding protein n=1 Tax=Weissella confusa TaxID=1583 RepID=UPI0032DA8C16